MTRGVHGSIAEHGTKARYQGNRRVPGCRCEACREAWRTFARAYYGHKPMAEYKATIEYTTHGRERMYVSYGCRCEPCTTAMREARQKRRERAKVPCEVCGTPTSPANSPDRRASHGRALCFQCAHVGHAPHVTRPDGYGSRAA